MVVVNWTDRQTDLQLRQERHNTTLASCRQQSHLTLKGKVAVERGNISKAFISIAVFMSENWFSSLFN